MKLSTFRSLDLRSLILLLALFSALATLANSLVVAYGVQRDALIQSTLEANRAYAAKVASSIDGFLKSAQSHLDYSGHLLVRDFDNPLLLRAETLRLQAQDEDFDAVVITDDTGRVLQVYPEDRKIIGSLLRSEEMQQAVKERRPLISHAYESAGGKLMVFISRPLIDPGGKFLGVLGGAVYIHTSNVLSGLISSHFHHDGTFAFVVDENRRLLHHPDDPRIGEILGASKTVDAALRGESGSMQMKNYKGIPMLAGYAPVASANWAVVAQQPSEQALATLGQLMKNMIIDLLPASLVGMALLWGGALLITRPLQQLAVSATQLSQPQTTEQLRKIDAWYKEPAAIRQALITSVQLIQQKIGRLREQAQSDPMTGLANRRAMDATLALFDQSQQPYSALELDIDFFKRVNDTYGHDAGDVALKQVATIIARHSRSGDLACRAGGEEFVLLLPDTDLSAACAIAERIRASIETTAVTGVGHITLSIGVGCRGPHANSAAEVLKQADENLYRAKQGGRNRVVG
ncbi:MULTISPECIES: sensor domain-containing diguanylate cyclase [unclassified Pseudomonas]|uniref:sensor domain-containing diguanylate cyclase n=1 Tax=unclassified Pseudomonas TaxID=196821 RepID=UPI0021C5CF85|nr:MULTISPECIES: sensor domain-containing diguanylate cyclase [unclassified Pseudomonas]MCU1735225.1 sensor domain-containing diguanylate cyclase [Pseudomonas sp. 20P_3.2_Bac4]MCU1746789.1 sensor domain-containing diguanylate cyclase [Pseudomonas sp. 20P_3.2_Bac5]